MIGLCIPELASRDYLSDNGLLDSGFLDLLLHCLGNLLLLFILEEYSAPILCSPVVSLAVHGGGVVDPEEILDLQQREDQLMTFDVSLHARTGLPFSAKPCWKGTCRLGLRVSAVEVSRKEEKQKKSWCRTIPGRHRWSWRGQIRTARPPHGLLFHCRPACRMALVWPRQYIQPYSSLWHL